MKPYKSDNLVLCKRLCKQTNQIISKPCIALQNILRMTNIAGVGGRMVCIQCRVG